MTFIKQMLAQINIDVEVLPMEPATLNDKIYVDQEEAEVNMWYVNWSASDFTMDGSVRSLLHSDMVPPTSANTAYFVNEDFDKLLDEGLQLLIRTNRLRFMARLRQSHGKLLRGCSLETIRSSMHPNLISPAHMYLRTEHLTSLTQCLLSKRIFKK